MKEAIKDAAVMIFIFIMLIYILAGLIAGVMYLITEVLF